MKVQAIVLVVGMVLCSATAKLCDVSPVEITTKWADMVSGCTTVVRAQVEMELNAAMTYLAMASHFARDTVNRPGFAEKFFTSAGEERDHAIKLISYLLMRGELVADLAQLIKNPEPVDHVWSTGLDALETALSLEVNVTNSIRNIIKVCEDEPTFNDYHIVDYLTSDFLEEQYTGQRELAGQIQTLGKMGKAHELPLAEFLFDKKLLNGEAM